MKDCWELIEPLHLLNKEESHAVLDEKGQIQKLKQLNYPDIRVQTSNFWFDFRNNGCLLCLKGCKLGSIRTFSNNVSNLGDPGYVWN